MNNITVTLPKEKYDKLIELSENFEERIKQEKEQYTHYLEQESLFLPADVIYEVLRPEDIYYSGYYCPPNYVLKDVRVHKNVLKSFEITKLKTKIKELQGELDNLNNNWFIKLFLK